MMERRAFLASAVATWLTAPRVATGQARKSWRIGLLTEGPSKDLHPEAPTNRFVDALRDLGYVEGQNLVIEYRHADNRPERIPEFAADLVRLKVDVIVAVTTRDSVAAKAATSTIPIVMLAVGDPVGAGLISSLARPGGNVTGTSVLMPDVAGKRLELLRDIVPKLRRVAILGNRQNASAAADMRATETAARVLGVTVHSVEVDSVSRLDAAFADIARSRPDGIVVIQDSITLWHRREIAAAALRTRLATVFPSAAYVKDGGLVGYGPDMHAVATRAASYVDKILKGARPGDLPVEQPTKFELVINLKTAKALGLTIPPSLLARADQVIDP